MATGLAGRAAGAERDSDGFLATDDTWGAKPLAAEVRGHPPERRLARPAAGDGCFENQVLDSQVSGQRQHQGGDDDRAWQRGAGQPHQAKRCREQEQRVGRQQEARCRVTDQEQVWRCQGQSDHGGYEDEGRLACPGRGHDAARGEQRQNEPPRSGERF
ncbi:hypothetical protein, partial [Streptomyces sp. XY332]|uniref:hypothetical protein n=1 Tax=Streptomyces sp. XY332 TaxID=1415561 RepID=UPI001F2B7FB3